MGFLPKSMKVFNDDGTQKVDKHGRAIHVRRGTPVCEKEVLVGGKMVKGFGKSKTLKSEAKKCDINTIMKKYYKTGIMPGEENKKRMFFADVSGVDNLQDALATADKSRASFMLLPAEIRSKFDNDPIKLAQFLSKDENAKEAFELGLIPKPQSLIDEEKAAMKAQADAQAAKDAADGK